MANALKDAGNKAFAAKEYDKAIDLFTQAIALDKSNHVFYSNRSAAYAGKRQYVEALADADQAVQLKPDWGKGHARRGAALHGLHRWDEAIAAYEAGIRVEDSPALQKGLREVRDAKASDEAADPGGFGKMFADPGLIPKLAANPKTQGFLADPGFMRKLQLIQSNPQLASDALQDPRMITVLGVLLGIDMQGFSRPEGSDELPPGVARDTPMHEEPVRSPPQSAPAPTPAPAPASAAAHTEDVQMEEDEEDDEAAAKKSAEAEKKTGADAYRARNFDVAAAAFQRAWDLWPKDITFLTNLAAAYFEQGNYDKCIEACELAVDEGRSMRADFKMIAKALGREGTAYHKKGDLENAIKFYNKSLSEHRTPDILNKLRDVEREKAAAEAKAYINPELADKAREEGNVLFKNGDFAGAVKAYTEAIKRSPTDARAYTNRAAAYTKLVALPEALKDSEEAISVDPTYVKAYLRKSMVLHGMREYSKAMTAAQEASEADVEKKHTQEIEQQMIKCSQGLYSERANETEEQTLQRAMRDPEVAQIMNDPVMQQILQQAQSDPAALQEHMKNPIVRGKIQKLVEAGIIRTR